MTQILPTSLEATLPPHFFKEKNETVWKLAGLVCGVAFVVFGTWFANRLWEQPTWLHTTVAFLPMVVMACACFHLYYHCREQLRSNQKHNELLEQYRKEDPNLSDIDRYFHAKAHIAEKKYTNANERLRAVRLNFKSLETLYLARKDCCVAKVELAYALLQQRKRDYRLTPPQHLYQWQLRSFKEEVERLGTNAMASALGVPPPHPTSPSSVRFCLSKREVVVDDIENESVTVEALTTALTAEPSRQAKKHELHSIAATPAPPRSSRSNS